MVLIFLIFRRMGIKRISILRIQYSRLSPLVECYFKETIHLFPSIQRSEIRKSGVVVVTSTVGCFNGLLRDNRKRTVAFGEICIQLFIITWPTKLQETEFSCTRGSREGKRERILSSMFSVSRLKGLRGEWKAVRRRVGSLFRWAGFQERGIQIRRVCPFAVGCGGYQVSYKSVLLLSRAEFIRLDSARAPSPLFSSKKKPTCPAPEFQTIYPARLSSVQIRRRFEIPDAAHASAPDFWMTDVTRHECLGSREIIANTRVGRTWRDSSKFVEKDFFLSSPFPLEIVSEIKIKMFFLFFCILFAQFLRQFGKFQIFNCIFLS